MKATIRNIFRSVKGDEQLAPEVKLAESDTF